MHIKNEEFSTKHEELCIKNDEICIKSEEICITNDEFCIKTDEHKVLPSRGQHTSNRNIIGHFSLQNHHFSGAIPIISDFSIENSNKRWHSFLLQAAVLPVVRRVSPGDPRSLDIGLVRCEVVVITRDLLQNSSFLIESSSFLIQISSFLMHNSSFLIESSSFLIHNFSILIQHSSFLLTKPLVAGSGPTPAVGDPTGLKPLWGSNSTVFICKIDHSLYKFLFSINNSSFVIQNSSFLIQNSSSLLTSPGEAGLQPEYIYHLWPSTSTIGSG